MYAYWRYAEKNLITQNVLLNNCLIRPGALLVGGFTGKLIHDIGRDIVNDHVTFDTTCMKAALVPFLPACWFGYRAFVAEDFEDCPSLLSALSKGGILLGKSYGKIFGTMGLAMITPPLLCIAKEFFQNKIASAMVKISHPKIKIKAMSDLNYHDRITIQLSRELEGNANTGSSAGSRRSETYRIDGKKEFSNDIEIAEAVIVQ
jgi:hypothetical protein